MNKHFSPIVIAIFVLVSTIPAFSQDFRATVSATVDAIRESREQNASPTEIKAIFAKAKEAEEDGCINFCGFYLGMTADDFRSLAAHYGLQSGEWGFGFVPSKEGVARFRFSLKGVRRITKGGNSFDELAQAVANRIGDMKPKHNDDYDIIGYEYKNIDGQTALISEKAGLACEDVNLSRDLELYYAEIRRKAANALDEVERMERESVWGKAKRSAIAKLATDMVPIPGKDYSICKYEVTQALWEAVMGELPYYLSKLPERLQRQRQGPDLPVSEVSPEECQKFIIRLNAIPEVKESGNTYRLPTQKEWEYACRAGATGEYCKLADGTEISTDTIGKVAWRGEWPLTVGKKEPNAFGLYDMLGNVKEWTSTKNIDGAFNNRDDVLCCTGYRANDGQFLSKDYHGHIGFRLAADKVEH